MNITAIAVGSQGDVKPFVELGKEMKKRGHNFNIGAFPRFKNYVEENGLNFFPVNGDGELMMKLLLTELKSGTDYLKGMETLFNKNPEMVEQAYTACQNADIVLYILLGGFVRHIAEDLNIPCVRCMFYPFDKTNQFSIQNPHRKRNSFLNGFDYITNEIGMNLVTKKLMNDWRKKHNLPKWHITSSYLKMNNEPVLTLYPFSEALVPRDPKWGSHIHITGFWDNHEETQYVPNKELEDFLNNGEKPIYIGFGSIVYSNMKEVQEKIMQAVNETGIRAIIQSGWTEFKGKENPNICYIDYVPHEWLFSKVKGVVHHGGAGTTYASLYKGCPTFIIAFGGDQYFWGLQVYERGLGPKPINLPKTKELSVEYLKSSLLDIKSGKYDENCKKISQKLQKENGCKVATDILEEYMKEKK